MDDRQMEQGLNSFPFISAALIEDRRQDGCVIGPSLTLYVHLGAEANRLLASLLIGSRRYENQNRLLQNKSMSFIGIKSVEE